jgi:DNA-binding transcriptional regulator YhcF (GntR family)
MTAETVLPIRQLLNKIEVAENVMKDSFKILEERREITDTIKAQAVVAVTDQTISEPIKQTIRQLLILIEKMEADDEVWEETLVLLEEQTNLIKVVAMAIADRTVLDPNSAYRSALKARSQNVEWRSKMKKAAAAFKAAQKK